MKIDEIASGLKAGDVRALARAISVVENRRPGYRQLLAHVYPLPGRALKIGITGAPGSGKSSLIERLIAHLKSRGLSIAVLAVDPSSPISGGALLGDRIRMIQHSNDRNVFIRSMASRGYLGGLTATAHEIIDVMEAAGRDVVIIETVGVGQSEIDVVNVADVVAMVMMPAAGDEIQIFKAGIIEVADIYVINKSDLGGADIKAMEIRNYFALSGKEPLIAETSAREDSGIVELIDQLFDFGRLNREAIRLKKESIRRELVMKIVQERVRERMEEQNDLFPRNLDGQDPFAAAESVYKKLFPGGTHDKKD